MQGYPEESGGSYYFSDENWAAMLQLSEEGKEEVNKAATKQAIDSAVIQAKQAMDLIEEKDGLPGKFYTLREAYDEGWLTRQDLMNISYYYHELDSLDINDIPQEIKEKYFEWFDEDFVATPKTPESLHVRVTNRIRKTYVEEFFGPIIAEISKDIDLDEAMLTIDHVSVLYYYGTYNDVVVLNTSSACYNYTIVLHEDEIVDGITFGSVVSIRNPDEGLPTCTWHRIKVWKAN